jgi:hypothetical protein
LGVSMVPWGPLATVAPPGRMVPRGPRSAPPEKCIGGPQGTSPAFLMRSPGDQGPSWEGRSPGDHRCFRPSRSPGNQPSFSRAVPRGPSWPSRRALGRHRPRVQAVATNSGNQGDLRGRGGVLDRTSQKLHLSAVPRSVGAPLVMVPRGPPLLLVGVVARGPRFVPPGRVPVVPGEPAQLFCRGPRRTGLENRPVACRRPSLRICPADRSPQRQRIGSDRNPENPHHDVMDATPWFGKYCTMVRHPPHLGARACTSAIEIV